MRPDSAGAAGRVCSRRPGPPRRAPAAPRAGGRAGAGGGAGGRRGAQPATRATLSQMRSIAVSSRPGSAASPITRITGSVPEARMTMRP